MSQFFQIHADHPQLRLIKQAIQLIKQGAIVATPTDSCFALACHLDDKLAVERVRKIRQVDERHHLTLLCRDLREISTYAKVDDKQYRLLKTAVPGPYTFILEATKEVPRRFSHRSRKTIGVRVPDNKILQALLQELGQPLLSATLILPGTQLPLTDAEEIRSELGKQIELIIDGGSCGMQATTVIDLTGDKPVVMREGRGELQRLGI